MPTFRTTPSAGLVGSIKRLMASTGGPSPLQFAQADNMAAETAQRMTLADKARQEVIDAQQAAADRRDPTLANEYAARVAGVTDPQASKISQFLSGALQPVGQPMQEEAANLGVGGLPDQPPTMPTDVTDAQRGAFERALSTLVANRIATGKTNVQQLTAGGGNLQDQSLQRDAVAAPDVPTENAIVAAISGKLRAPFKAGSDGQIVNQETGGVNEGTKLARAAIELSGAKTGTEGARQADLGARTTLAGAQTALADARTGAVKAGLTDKGGHRVDPQQVETWISRTASSEWKTLKDSYDPSIKGMHFGQYLAQVRKRFKDAAASGVDPKQELSDAQDAIAHGADPAAVAKRFKQRTGLDLPANN